MIKIAKRTLLLLLGIVLVATTTVQPTIALTTPQAVEKGGPAYEESISCGLTAIVPQEVEGFNEAQIQNAKTVIGIAKTYDLGQEGALIGLMTALAESGLNNYYNNTIPVSMDYPGAVEPPYDDHDSVGIMQQRPEAGWSTFGSGTSQEIVFQIMNPAYSAQAFFGTPPNAQLPNNLEHPGAIQKGLQNLSPDWRTLEPQVAAQRVQISAYDGNPRDANNYSSIFGENYLNQTSRAQFLLAALWDNSTPVPLPISITDQQTGTNPCLGGSATDMILARILEYAWPDYRNPRDNWGYAIQKRPAYQEAVDRQPYSGGYGEDCPPGGLPGVDCGGFVTVVMRESGADPEYNIYEASTRYQLRYLNEYSVGNTFGNPERYLHLPVGEPPQPGDIAIRHNGNSGHTYFYVGQLPNFNSDIASASWCERAPMAGHESAENDGDFEWFRLIAPAGTPGYGPVPEPIGGQQP